MQLIPSTPDEKKREDMNRQDQASETHDVQENKRA